MQSGIETKKGIADIHIHSSGGDGLASVYQILEYVENKTELDIIAITDHDNFKTSLYAKELSQKKKYRFKVVLGMEVTTIHGHLLAIFIDNPIFSYQSLEHTIEAVHNQGGFCIAPHSMSWLYRSIGQTTLDKFAYRSDGIYLDGIEVVNSNIHARISHEKTKRLNRKRYHLAEIGSSDAHFLYQIGSAYTFFEGNTEVDFKLSLKNRKTIAYYSPDLYKSWYSRIIDGMKKLIEKPKKVK